MKNLEPSVIRAWFDNCGGWDARHDLTELRRGIAAGLVDLQDEFGMTALSLATTSKWREGVEELLHAGADPERRYFRTGATTLYMAVQERDEAIIAALVSAGADPDAPNYWGQTPRVWASRQGRTWFDDIPANSRPLPRPRIQNAEHLAEHFHPSFEIPGRDERERLSIGQAVDLYVYGPKSEAKQDTVKVRVASIVDGPMGRRYVGRVETPLARTHLDDGTTELEFGPENVATVYVARPPE